LEETNMSLWKITATAAAALVLAGCATAATAARYTWTGDAVGLERAHAACIQETAPRVHMYTPRPVMEDFYKNCMERRGLTKTASERVPVGDAAKTCGSAAQTCVWMEPVTYATDSPLRTTTR
jgi:hypothetical protein